MTALIVFILVVMAGMNIAFGVAFGHWINWMSAGWTLGIAFSLVVYELFS